MIFSFLSGLNKIFLYHINLQIGEKELHQQSLNPDNWDLNKRPQLFDFLKHPSRRTTKFTHLPLKLKQVALVVEIILVQYVEQCNPTT